MSWVFLGASDPRDMLWTPHQRGVREASWLDARATSSSSSQRGELVNWSHDWKPLFYIWDESGLLGRCCWSGERQKLSEPTFIPHSHSFINFSHLCLDHQARSRHLLPPSRWLCPGGWWSVAPPRHCRKVNMPAHATASSIIRFKSSSGFPTSPGTFF